MLKNLAVFLLLAMPLAAARYTVVLATEPVAAYVTQDKRGLSGEAGVQSLRSVSTESRRARIHTEQETFRKLVEQRGGRVLGKTDTLLNAIFVDVDEIQAAALARMPGVARVSKSRLYKPYLDAAAMVHHLPQAWTVVGGTGKAGAGIKIGIIDSGIQQSLPGFQDDSLVPPAGFPAADTTANLKLTNKKVIVARSYPDLWPNFDIDNTAQDRAGHGTAVSTCAASVQITGPLATISGFAPKAFLGSYKIFGTPGYNDFASDESIIQALEDATNDGMDIVNLSLGATQIVYSSEDNVDVAIEAASALGVLVISSAGNDGPGLQSIGDVSGAPSAISVGATENARAFANSIVVPNAGPYIAYPGDQTHPGQPLTAPVVDVATLNGDGTGCSPIPANGLQGKIGLFARLPAGSSCLLANAMSAAQAAGAVAAIIYTDPARSSPGDIGDFTAGSATIPGELIYYSDGVDLKNRVGADPGLQATINLSNSAVPTSSNQISSFSSAGPSIDYTIKPELVAVGDNLYMQAETLYPSGILYDPSGFATAAGTSFSSPIVAGSAAVLKASHPGLTVAQYRSLLINSASTFTPPSGVVPSVIQVGAGLLNVANVVTSNTAVVPATMSFGVGSGSSNLTRTLTVYNVGTTDDQFQLSVAPRDGGVGPQLSASILPIPAGGSGTVTVTFPNAPLAAGSYEGYLHVASSAQVDTRVPYWFGVPSQTPAQILDVASDQTDPAGEIAVAALVFKTIDASGIVIPNPPGLTVTAVSGGGTVVRVGSLDGLYPGTLAATVQLGPNPGDNIFQVAVGSAVKLFTITGQ